MRKIFSIFNARNNWKTTIVIFSILSIALILIICILPTQIDVNGEYRNYYLFGYGKNSLYQVKKDVEAANAKFLWTFSYGYIFFVSQQLIAILGWFFVLNFFVIIHFALIKKPNRKVRLVNALILFFASIILVVSVVNYMVAYVQITNAYTEIISRTETLTKEVGKTKLGKTKQAVMFILAFQFFIISAWNLHVERKTEYRFNTELKIKRELKKAKKSEKKVEIIAAKEAKLKKIEVNKKE